MWIVLALALLLICGWRAFRRTLGFMLLVGVWATMYPQQAARVGASIDSTVGLVSYIADPDDNDLESVLATRPQRAR